MTEKGCKVCRVLDDRGMSGYESRMVAHWKGEGGQRMGYRQLADWINVTLLRREMDRAGLSTLGDEAESKYDRLRGEDTVAEEVRADLRTAGVPIDGVEDDFVSYGVVRTHLRECLGEEYEVEASDWEADSIEIAREHAAEKITEAVRSAVSKGNVTAVGDVSVHVSVELECDETHVRVPVDRAMRRGYVSQSRDDGPPEDGGGSPEREESSGSDGAARGDGAAVRSSRDASGGGAGR